MKTNCPTCTPGVSRRNFLRFSLGASAAAASTGVGVPSLFSQDTVAKAKQAKSIILLWMGGGPSQLDTWDPKAGEKTGGPFKAIQTSVRGMMLSEHMEKVAAQAKNLALIRAVTTKEAAHERGHFLMHTCFSPIPGQEFAAMGTVVASELTPKNFALPGFIAISPPGIPQSPAFPEEFQAFSVAGTDRPVPNVELKGISKERQAERDKLLDDQNKTFEEDRQGREVEKTKVAMEKAEDLMNTPLLHAFDIKKEPEALRKEYGGRFGQNCLMARRLVEAGVRFVEVGLGGWDTHADNFKKVEKLVRDELDPGMGTLLKDLDQRGMMKDTLVICMGEFGRTPEINGGDGRDHWCKCFSVALAGCGVGGRIIGSTDKTGMEISDRAVTVPDLFASIYQLIGIEPNKHYIINNRKVKYSYGGKPVRELF